MKEFNIYFIIVKFLLLSGLMTSVSAQEITDKEHQTRDTVKQTLFGIRSVGIQLGWYKPSMDYWNETFFKENNWQNKFEGSFYYNAFLDLNIVNNLRVRTGFSNWKETVESGEIQAGGMMGNNKLEVSLTSFPTDIIYQPAFLAFEKFEPYIGLGGSFLLIQHKYTHGADGITKEELIEQGQDFTGHFLVGIERPIFPYFSLGLEFNYVFGKYVLEVDRFTGNQIQNNVSIKGPQIGLTLAYTFKQ